jgi:hypothetical protein
MTFEEFLTIPRRDPSESKGVALAKKEVAKCRAKGISPLFKEA